MNQLFWGFLCDPFKPFRLLYVLDSTIGGNSGSQKCQICKCKYHCTCSKDYIPACEENIERKGSSQRWITEMWTTGGVALLHDEGVVGGGGWGAGWCQCLSLSKRNQLTGSLGAERHILPAFMEPRLLSPASPGATRETQVSAGLPVTWVHAWIHTTISCLTTIKL